MVDREVTFASTISQFEVIEKLVTLTCVSNPVGGDLIGNASGPATACGTCWRDAGVHPDADMVLSKSIDGFTAGTPWRRSPTTATRCSPSA